MIIHDKKLIDMESNKLSKEEFIKKVKSLGCVRSVEDGIVYSLTKFTNGKCDGERETGGNFTVDLDKLYDAYCENDVSNLTTTKLKDIIMGYNQSPALAILRAVEDL